MPAPAHTQASSRPSPSETVPAGYKQTEVGVIPEDWECLPLGELFSSTQLGGNYPNSERPTGSPLIKMGNLGRGSIKLDKLEYITPSTSASQRDRLTFGDVLFNTRNTLVLVGKVSIWRGELPEAYFNSNIMRLKFDEQKVSSNMFMNLILNTPQSLSSLRGIAIGTTSVAAIYNRDLVTVSVPVPSKPEQEAIAEALSDADAWIASLEQLIATKRRIKESSMQELLTGKRRLPGFSGEWEEKTLGELGIFFKGNGVRKHEAKSGNLPCVRYGEIYTIHEDIVRSFNSWISLEVAETATPLRKGDLLFAGSGETKEEIGKCVAFVHECEAFAGGDIVILRPQGVSYLFLGYFLNTAEVQRKKASRGQGDAVVHISSNALASIDVKLPPESEQTAIAEVLSDMDAEIESLEAKLSKARQIKQGMMQELLTGKTRLV